MKIAMTIAGSDSSGGAGIQADLKTFQELGVYGTSVITALTAQNTMQVTNIFPVEPSFVGEQLRTVIDDLPIHAIKTGMLYSATIMENICQQLSMLKIPIVVDPVMVAKGGACLLQQDAIAMLKEQLIRIATVITPNIPEAELITGITINGERDIEQAAQYMLSLGAKHVVIKGGHLHSELATDYIFSQKQPPFKLTTARIDTRHTHGTGCTFSAALTAFLSQGNPINDALFLAKSFISAAIADPLHIGHGHGPTNHFAYQANKHNFEVSRHDY